MKNVDINNIYYMCNRWQAASGMFYSELKRCGYVDESSSYEAFFASVPSNLTNNFLWVEGFVDLYHQECEAYPALIEVIEKIVYKPCYYYGVELNFKDAACYTFINRDLGEYFCDQASQY